jgi:SEC-C motif
MLERPVEVTEQLAELVSQSEAGGLDARRTAEKILAIAPDHAPSHLLLALAMRQDGNMEGAEALHWKAIDEAPCTAVYYLTLEETLRQRCGIDHPLLRRLRRMALQKLAGADEIQPIVAEIFLDSAGDGIAKESWDFMDPETYQFLLTMSEVREKLGDEPENDRLLPYRVLADFQQQAIGMVEYKTLHEILDNRERCLPLLRAAFREWVEGPSDLGHDALCLMMAIMGEIGAAEDMEDLWGLSEYDDLAVFGHAHFGLYRFGQRMPEAALALIRKRTPGAPVAMRCGFAEQLVVLPNVEGLTETLLELLDDLPSTKHEDDGYLLMLVTHGLAALGNTVQVQEVMARNVRRLSKPGRRYFEDAIEAEDFLPLMLREGVNQLDLDEVVLERELLGEEEDEDEDPFDEEEDDEDIEPVVKPAQPGRNEACWCGSGKKYKKCHLQADEDAARKGDA